jgi:peptide methionine sulfoxide reductase msrA/msrB
MFDERKIVLAGGCFWGVQHYLSLIPGVVDTQVGYANGRFENPTYEQVCTGTSGFTEAVMVTYDRNKLGLSELLDLFYKIVDPTSVNKQGNDVGPQYRTGIYYDDPADEPIVKGSLVLLGESLERPVAIESCSLKNFYPAEKYHQKYLENNPGGYCHLPVARFEEARRYKPLQGPDTKLNKAKLRERLSSMQFEVTQHGATEPPFANEYFDLFEPGIYVDVVDGRPLFLSTQKFDSGCGWPSFSRPIDESYLSKLPDYSHSRVRTEVRSQQSGSHLGHVFSDGPRESGGLRYCINSASLRFVPKNNLISEGYGELLPLFDFDAASDKK